MRRLWRFLGGAGLTLALSLAAAAQPLKFAVLADTHVGADGGAERLARLVDLVNADPSLRFVVVAGDVTEKGRDEELRAAREALSRLKVPFRVVPGNHDTHWAGFGGIGFAATFGGDRFSFAESGAFFLGISAWDQGHIAQADLAWLEAEVRKVPADADLFLFVHDPPPAIDDWARAQAALRTRRAIVISGHIHADSQDHFHGLPFWTVGAAYGKPDDPPTLAVVTIDKETVEIGSFESAGIVRLWGSFSRRGRPEAEAMEAAKLVPGSAEILWRRELGARLDAAPVTDGKRIFAADHRGRVTAWDLKGNPEWTYEAKSPFVSRPATQEKYLLAASVDGRLHKIDAARGSLAGSASLDARPISPIVAYQDPQGKISRFWLGTSQGRLYCVNTFNLTAYWTSEAARGPIQSPPVGVGGKVVFGAWDGAAHAADASTGRELWRWTENDNFYYSPAGCAPATDGKLVFVCAPDGFVSAVAAATGKTAWRVQAASWESLGLSDDGRRLLVKTRLDEFRVLDAATGRDLRRITPAHGKGDLGTDTPLEWKGRILYGSRFGKVLSIDESGRVATLLDLGPGTVHTLLPLGGGRFVASNVDGAVVAFRIAD